MRNSKTQDQISNEPRMKDFQSIKSRYREVTLCQALQESKLYENFLNMKARARSNNILFLKQPSLGLVQITYFLDNFLFITNKPENIDNQFYQSFLNLNSSGDLFIQFCALYTFLYLQHLNLFLQFNLLNFHSERNSKQYEFFSNTLIVLIGIQDQLKFLNDLLVTINTIIISKVVDLRVCSQNLTTLSISFNYDFEIYLQNLFFSQFPYEFFIKYFFFPNLKRPQSSVILNNFMMMTYFNRFYQKVSKIFNIIAQSQIGIRIYQVFEYQQHLKSLHQFVIKLPKMGSTCLKIPITTNDINLNEEVGQELKQSNQQKKEIQKIIDESVCSDDEIQLTSHSFEEIQENSNQSKYSMIKKLDQSVTIKSILKSNHNSQLVQTSSIRKSVSFCLIAPDKYKEMINCSAKLSSAQKEFLDSLCSSQ